MNKILALWAIPRSASTAFEWMMRQRGDFACRHEPFGEVWYYGEDCRTPRPNDTPPKSGLTYASVWQQLRREASKSQIFIKDFPHYILHIADDAFLSHFRHSFLIRDPAKVLPSMFDKWPGFLVEETGYAEQHKLFELIKNAYGTPPVIDADDLVDHPDATVRAYCEAVDIPFISEALSWESGKRKEISWYDKGSWHGNLKASTGLKPQNNNYLDVDANEHLRHAYELCLPHYQALRKYRLRSGEVTSR